MGLKKLTSKIAKHNLPTYDSFFQTPFLLADLSLGGGIREKAFHESFAPEGLGKTTFNNHILSFYLYQRPKAYFAIFDVEKSIDYSRLDYYFYQVYDPNIESFEFNEEEGIIYINGEDRGIALLLDTYEEINRQFKEFANICQEEKREGIIVWDSLVSAVSEKILKGKNEGLSYKARTIQEFLDENYPIMRKVGITVLAINQVREKIKDNLYVADRTTGLSEEGDVRLAGGKAHKFMAHQMFQFVNKGKWVYASNERMIGRKVSVIPTKNKIGADRRPIDLVFVKDYGFSNIISILEFLKDKGLFAGSMAQGKFTENEKLHNLISDGNKTFNLDKLVEKLIDDEEVLEEFYNYTFQVAFEHYKEKPRQHRYTEEVKQNQKLAIKLDAYKLDFYLKNYFV
jgi:RecA/RadA recombinase